jgi:hypothetical protein
MNKATTLFAITTAGLAIVSAHLARALHLERERAASLPALIHNAPSSGAQSPKDSPHMATAAGAATTPRPIVPDASTIERPSPEKTRDELPARVRNRTYREADLAYRRLDLQKKYPDLASSLGLRPDEVNKFFDLLAKQSVNDEAAQWNDNETLQQDPEARLRLRKQRERNTADEQAAFLGEERAAGWQKYLNSLGARGEVGELRTMLADSDYPLRRDQYAPLVDLLANEQVRHASEREQLFRSGQRPTGPTHEEVIKQMGKRLELIEQSLERRRRAAETVLDSEQLRRYQLMLDVEHGRAQAEYDAVVTQNAEEASMSSSASR